MTTATPIRTAYVTRIEHFSAAHRLNSVHLSAAENIALFGKCNHTSGHGHNYKVEVTIKGQINPQSGMVINITDLKKTLHAAVMDPCDHRNLDIDVPYFKSTPSTTENLAVFLWENINLHLPPSDTYELYEVKIHETDKNVVVYRGE
ncbi:6-pyruvoyltetrahydropterin/6-carboxytetrahydropterin synthase [Entomortierella parvispora]|uniref:6-pyruvoyltetrahydropterin synthase n=1 Tax=Entomortierella parvispora TaxID=205924 RepID=A0A9P3HLT2_9FUNG|nr:6-pyruvoyltetrahydropterin/6-carboxytetrahydropterin synthase [Entomortierella parvispora]